MSDSQDQRELARMLEYLDSIENAKVEHLKTDQTKEQEAIVAEIQEALSPDNIVPKSVESTETIKNPDFEKSEYPIVWFPCEALKGCPGRQAYKIMVLPNGVSRYQCLTCTRMFGVAVGGSLNF